MPAINPFLLFALGVAASMLVIPLVWKVAPQIGLIDMPDARKVHSAPVPRVGGWGITFGTLVPLLLSFQLDPLLQSFVLGALTLFVFGVWDDAKELGHWTKFVGQVIAVGIVVTHGGLYVTRLPFLETIVLDPISGRLFTIFALIGAINASNHSDGLDGLAGGEALLSLIAMAALGYVVGDSLVVGIALATIGGILGFLRYNSHPARVFMGDSGSQVLGFTLGFLVVYLTQVAHTAISAALPLLLLGLPIADLAAVLYLRMRHGSNWFRATRNHVHHRLLDLGFAHYETVIIIYSMHAALVVGAVLLRYEADWLVAASFLALVGTLFVALGRAERAGFRLHKGRNAEPAMGMLDRVAALRRLLFTVIAAAVPVLLLLGSSAVETVPRDFGVAAAALAVVLAVEGLRTRGVGSVMTRTASYAAAVFVAYLLAFYPGGAAAARVLPLVATTIIAVAVACYVRFSSRQEFGTTPTDFLVVFGVLALIAFGSIAADSRAAAQLVACAAVLLYGFEVVIGRGGAAARWLNAATLAAFAIIALRGLA